MPSDVASDARRDERLTALGIIVIRIPEHDVWHRGAGVAASVRSARQAGRARHGQPPLAPSRAA